MAKLNLEYYSGENHYSDGDIEEEILKLAQEGKSLSQLGKVEFPILYHLSKVRENILNWYPFKKEASCLEIGSGCGAISGLLCERMQKVTSVELSKRRADINFARHQDKENLEIMVGNLNDMVFSEKFDYIVLNGVFEYAMSFTPGDHPYEDFLTYIAGFLKPDGILLIAIENRLGLKYFAGAPEDHTNAYMDGLKNYPGNHSVRTFSKKEWKDLMKTCGLEHDRFYYPYPDYKFPCEVFTDETIESQKYGRKNWNFTENRFELFPEHEMAETLRKEGIMDRFANSFLIEMSRAELPKEQVIYAKLNTDRAEEFAICTTLKRSNGQVQVEKSALTEQAKAHIEAMYRREQQETDTSGRLLQGMAAEGKNIYPFLQEKSLGFAAAQAVADRDPQKVRALVKEVEKLCEKKRTEEDFRDNEAFVKVFGDAVPEKKLAAIQPANIDLILDNLFDTEQGRVIIDGEWIFDFPIPISFVLWRTINDLYTNMPWLKELIERKDFLAEYEIDQELEQVFYRWAMHFERVYVKANGLALYSTPEIGVSLEEIRKRRIEETYIDSTLYLDTGKGFSEEETIRIKSKPEDGRIDLHFELPEDKEIQAIRFDPLEGIPCICELQSEQGTLIAQNAVETEGNKAVFITTDPVYVLQTGEKRELHITGTIQRKTKDWALEKYRQLLEKQNRRWKFWK